MKQKQKFADFEIRKENPEVWANNLQSKIGCSEALVMVDNCLKMALKTILKCDADSPYLKALKYSSQFYSHARNLIIKKLKEDRCL